MNIKRIFYFLSLIFLITLMGCTQEYAENRGEVLVAGRFLPYECMGCEGNIDHDLLKEIVKEGIRLEKKRFVDLIYFSPNHVDIIILKEDSLYDFVSGRMIENVFSVNVFVDHDTPETHRKKGSTMFTLVDNEIKDVIDQVKLTDLRFIEGRINRVMLIYGENSFMEIRPHERKGIIVENSITCIEKGSWVIITLSNHKEVKLQSLNEFNCEGTLYLPWPSPKDSILLSEEDIISISVVGHESISVDVPINQRDYFKQLMEVNVVH